jgi:hypothetical protein
MARKRSLFHSIGITGFEDKKGFELNASPEAAATPGSRFLLGFQ